MSLIGLGSVTIVAMFLWVIVSVIDRFAGLPGCKTGLAAAYLVAVVWATGLVGVVL